MVSRTRKTQVIDDEIDNEVSLNELPTTYDDDDIPDDQAIKSAVLELGGEPESEVKIYRSGIGKDLTFLFSIHPSEFKLSELQKEYGSGKYRIYIFGSDGRQVTNRTIKIEGKPNQNNQQQNNANNDMSVLAQLMAQTMSKGFENLGQLILQNKTPQVDPNTMMNNMLQQMVLMKQVMGGNENVNPFEKSLDMFQKGLEMAKEINPVQNGESTTTDILLEAVKGFMPVIAQASLQNQNAQQNQQPINQQLPNPNAQQLQPPKVNPQMNMYKFYLNMACDKAAKNADPELYAELVLDNLTDEQITAILSNPNPIDELAKIEPKVLNHKEWFSQLLNAINAMLTDSGDGDINTENDITLNNDLPSELIDALNESQVTEN